MRSVVAPAAAPARARGRLGTFVAASLLLAGLALVGVDASSPAPAAAATSGCRQVGGGASDTGGGPNRATVVVDTGSGTVWSACISFSGGISGIEALERAQSVITDLNPVYDQYAGLGRAVCRLRGVGTDPPDCLGKSVNFWSFSVNGRVAPVGAGSVTVRDGDVHGWRHGTGGVPRAAGSGTEATSAPPPTTTTTRPAPTTTRPAPTTTRPPGTVPGTSTAPGGVGGSGSNPGSGSGSSTGGSASGGGSTSGSGANGSPADGTRPGDDAATGDDAGDGGAGDADVVGGDVDGADSDDGASSAADDGASTTGDDGGSGRDGHGDGDGEQAAGAASGASGPGGTAGGSSGGGSSAGSVLGFLAAIGLVGAGALVVRRRRLATVSPAAASDPTPA